MLELRTRQVEQERAQKLLAEAQLSALESRIHPHFLFNTLNSIAALIPRDPKRAEDMIGKLASLLRFSLNAGQTGLVPLGQELQTVRDYLEIEKARFDTRLSYTIAVPAEAENIGVPPLSVESLVENSIKHVIARRREGGEVRVSASMQWDRLEIEVSDSGPGFAMDLVPAGHGLDNLSGRLTLLFGGEARLETVRNGKYATVRVSLPRKA
jgi:LytS/YehU family sensor histidine kinase